MMQLPNYRQLSGTFKRFILSLFIIYIGPICAEDLITVYNQAVQEDPQLDRAKENLAVIQEFQNQANANLFLPQATFSANVNKDWQTVSAGSTQAVGINGSSNFIYGGYTLTLTQPILHYDRIIQWQQADTRIAQAETQFAATESELLLKVATRYFDVLSAEENLSFAQAQQASLSKKLNEIMQREAAGYLALTDVQEGQASYDRAVSDTIEAEQKLRDAQESLQEVTGLSYIALTKLNDDIPLIPPDPEKETRWVEQALTQNLSLKANEYDIKVAKSNIDIQKAGHLPTLDATGTHGFQTTGGRFGSVDQDDTTIGLALNVPLYQGGQVSSRIRQAEHLYRETLATYKQTQRSVQRNASQAYFGVTTGISRLKSLQQTLKSSETALKATEAGFRAGYRTPLDLIIAEREHLGVQRDYSSARYNYILSTLKLKNAVGTLSPEDLAKVNAWLIKEPALK